MRYNPHFFIMICVLITILSCSSMERDNQLQEYNHNHWLNSVQEITAVKNPLRVKYFIENELVVVESNGRAHRVNLKTQEKQTIQERGSYWGYITVFQSNNRMFFCNFSRLEVVTLNKEIGSLDFTKNWLKEDKNNKIRSFAWDSLKDILFVCYGESKMKVTQHNYATGISKDIIIDDQVCQTIIMHPKKEVMCMADYSGNISLRNVDDTLSKIKTISLRPKIDCSWFCQYSPDGSRIVVGNSNRILIVNPNKSIDEFPCVDAQAYEIFKNIAFHPNGSILAILLNRKITISRLRVYNKQIVRYWDLKTQRFIGETPGLIGEDSYDLCFSDDGLEVVIALENKCAREHVFFAIKDKYMYHFYKLNKIKGKMKKKFGLPEELARYIVNLFLESLRRF